MDELLDNLDKYRMSDTGNLDKAVYMHTKQKAMETIRSALETRTDNQGYITFEYLIDLIVIPLPQPSSLIF